MIKVLIANDERTAVNLLQRLINRNEEMSYIGHAVNGAEAVRMAQALRPDVVLMDVMMPGMDGLEATRQIRNTVPETRIVVNTARSDYYERALEAGASIVLTIPITQESILKAIRQAYDDKSS